MGLAGPGASRGAVGLEPYSSSCRAFHTQTCCTNPSVAPGCARKTAPCHVRPLASESIVQMMLQRLLLLLRHCLTPA